MKDNYITSEKRRKKDSKWRYKNPNYHRDYNRKNNERLKVQRKAIKKRNYEYVMDIKKKSCCQICGEKDYRCLLFHHRDPSIKFRTIYEMTFGQYSIERLRKEIDKCDLVCANCHHKIHFTYYGVEG